MTDQIERYGFCGKDCHSCPKYNDKKEDSCTGCKAISSVSITCNIKFCAEKSGVSFCPICSKFPCTYFSFFTPEELTELYQHKELIIKAEISSL
ncbi:MAG: DUF3795 domain-containing protein [Spirochaetes bacterium]|nr:DUF3795 domain-containing protein [Spirochaetota bacterium]NLJ05613.1 DUF3795 domain-containing protein [Exilispira sp.]MBP8990393.1 DUF3795 domain-containing protein [Spirochaetota bacterium]HNV44392.1 DUF3795 domain-containing protein [Exilispira sp.]HOV46814.1 DUF3795 domain-containing protein [Exilispira sp.]